MSSGDRFVYSTGPKAPPPEHGIRMKRAGATWWGQRWIEALQVVLEGDAGRLSRGRTYARAGRAHDLVVKDGVVSARVTGSRPTPYHITIRVSALAPTAWTRAIAAMARKAQFSAELLAGEMPRAIDEAFLEAGVSLFPRDRSDLRTSCSCPDWGDPCKHVAATHYVLGEAIDRDPFLLFELRGRTRDQVLAALRAARSEPTTSPTTTKGKRARNPPPGDAPPEVPTVTLEGLQAADYGRLREPLPALHFRFDEPVGHGAVLRQLGAPSAWEAPASPAEMLAPLVRAAAENARRIALGESVGSSPDASKETATCRGGRRDLDRVTVPTGEKAPMNADNQRKLAARVATAAEAALAKQEFVSPLDVLIGIGWLDPATVSRWRQGQLPFLEAGISTNLERISAAMAMFRSWASERQLRPSETGYVAKNPGRARLRFSKSNDATIERLYRTHWVSPALSENKRKRLEEAAQRPPELVVVSPLEEGWQCHRCGGTGDLLIMEPPGPACLPCAGLGTLVFLAAGDAGLSRRAKAKSALYAVVVRFSRARKRYERQGLLVEPDALREAERACPAATRGPEKGAEKSR